MKLVIDQELAQQVLNVVAKQPYQDVFQLVPKLLQLQILPEAAATVDTAAEVQAATADASTAVAQEITASN